MSENCHIQHTRLQYQGPAKNYNIRYNPPPLFVHPDLPISHWI